MESSCVAIDRVKDVFELAVAVAVADADAEDGIIARKRQPRGSFARCLDHRRHCAWSSFANGDTDATAR